MAGEKGLPDVLSVNINGDLEDDELIKLAKRFRFVWVGYNPMFKDPFYVADLIADYVDFLGFGVLTVDIGCRNILESFENLRNSHRDTRFALGIGSGSRSIRETLNCLKFLRDKVDFLFVGCSGPKITAESSKIADGILFNYAHPEYLRWISSFVKRDVLKVAYAPALILPSEFEKDLLIASAIVSCSSGEFVRRFGYVDMCKTFSKLNFGEVILMRKRFNFVPKEIEEYRDVLIERFSIAGEFDRFVWKIREILKVCDHVVLGDPFFRDRSSSDLYDRIISQVRSSDTSRVF